LAISIGIGKFLLKAAALHLRRGRKAPPVENATEWLILSGL
jgi:hypothetical protein